MPAMPIPSSASWPRKRSAHSRRCPPWWRTRPTARRAPAPCTGPAGRRLPGRGRHGAAPQAVPHAGRYLQPAACTDAHHRAAACGPLQPRRRARGARPRGARARRQRRRGGRAAAAAPQPARVPLALAGIGMPEDGSERAAQLAVANPTTIRAPSPMTRCSPCSGAPARRGAGSSAAAEASRKRVEREPNESRTTQTGAPAPTQETRHERSPCRRSAPDPAGHRHLRQTLTRACGT